MKISDALLEELRCSPRQATVEEVADALDDLLWAREEIKRLTHERALWKERHDRELAAHQANLGEQKKLETRLEAMLHGGDRK